MSKVCESVISYTSQHLQYDPQLNADQLNPWVNNDESYWAEDAERGITIKRASKWKFSFRELLKDPCGIEEFRKFLQKEFSAENLDFWLDVRSLKCKPIKQVKESVQKIFDEYLSDETPNPINIDSKIKEKTIKNMENPDRYCFEEAQEHIHHLMKTDSYARFLKAEQYKGYTQAKRHEKSSRPRILGQNSPYNTLVNESNHSES